MLAVKKLIIERKQKEQATAGAAASRCWQNSGHTKYRKMMNMSMWVLGTLSAIVSLLRRASPRLFSCYFANENSIRLVRNQCTNSPPEFIAKLPSMSTQLELVLYSSARSFEEYANRATLPKRMREATRRITESFSKWDGDHLDFKTSYWIDQWRTSNWHITPLESSSLPENAKPKLYHFPHPNKCCAILS